MPELRWTLLIIGVLFVGILAWWERRRPHQASRQAPHIGEDPRPVVTDNWGSATEGGREPALTLPEIRTDIRSPAPTPPPPVHVDREPTSPRELPVVEIPDDAREVVLAEPRAASAPPPPSRPPAPHAAAGTAGTAAPGTVAAAAVPPAAANAAAATALSAATAASSPHAAEALPPHAVPKELPPPPTEFLKPIVEWPPEDQRTIVSLRLVARPPERFRGNLLRQALAAEGFVLGDFDIFHKPDANNRAVLSASNLSKPGTFDSEAMDTQRFIGLSLIAVLPGPKSPQKAFDDLLMTARTLNERLEGALQDDKGGPLTPMRVQALRDALGEEAKS